MKNILFSVFLLLPIFVFSQTGEIHGKIIYNNGTPAPYVNVWLENTQKGSVTDSLGKFIITSLPSDKYRLKASSVGYKTYQLRIDLKKGEKRHLPLIILKPSSEKLDQVVIETQYRMKVERRGGELEVKVAHTRFQNAPNAWEGLKKVPLLSVSENTGIKVFNQTAIVEIDGIRTQMSGEQLQDFLESLDPNSIKKLELQPNPGAAYGTEVKAVVNIILKNGRNDYRLGISTTNGFHTKYFNESNISYAYNLKDFRIYANYGFSYIPKIFEGKISKDTKNSPLQEFEYKEKHLPRKHNALLNISFDIGEKNTVNFTQIFSLSNAEIFGRTTGNAFEKTISKQVDNTLFQFAQVWKHEFSDSASVEVGAYEIFQNSKSFNRALINNSNRQKQTVSGDIPLFIAYIDYSNENKWGTTVAGIKYDNISVENKNQFIVNGQEMISPYWYNEAVLALYAQHSFAFSPMKSLRIGLRSETSFINYEFNAGQQSFANSKQYTNLMYNLSYNWATSKRRIFNLSFKKQVQRPDYSSLNPFQTISSNITYFSGDTSLDPAKFYLLSFYTYKKGWLFYGQTGLIKDFISSFYKIDNNRIITTYQNFENVYLASGGLQYNHSFFDHVWTTKTSASISFYKLKDPRFEIAKSTPSITLGTINSFKISNDLRLDVDFSYSPTSRDGLLVHHSSARLDASLTKELGDNFTLILFADDILNTSRQWASTTVPNFFYETKLNLDSRAIGLSLKWSISGKAYKERSIVKPEDEAINRL